MNIRQTQYRQDSLVVSSVAVSVKSARPPYKCVGRRRHFQCDRRTHSDAERTCLAAGPIQFTPPHQTRQDSLACRPPPPRLRPGRQLRLAARPPTRSDVVRHAKYKHAVDCCICVNLNFFNKRQATTVIYRLTVQTLPDGPETQFTPPDATQTALALSCRVWPVV